jgi:hypothetical protein
MGESMYNRSTYSWPWNSISTTLSQWKEPPIPTESCSHWGGLKICKFIKILRSICFTIAVLYLTCMTKQNLFHPGAWRKHHSDEPHNIVLQHPSVLCIPILAHRWNLSYRPMGPTDWQSILTTSTVSIGIFISPMELKDDYIYFRNVDIYMRPNGVLGHEVYNKPTQINFYLNKHAILSTLVLCVTRAAFGMRWAFWWTL